MADPCVDQTLVEVHSLLQVLVPCFIIIGLVVTFGTVCSGHEMDHCLVSSIPQLDGTPARLIKNGLPHVLARVCAAIHDTTITKDDRGLIARLRDLYKDIFKIHLQFHQIYLKFDCVTKAHFRRLNQCPANHENGGRFRNNEHPVPNLFQM